jgi:hypothetical protein
MAATATVHHPDLLAGWRSALSAPAGRVVIVNVPMSNFLMVEGIGDARSDEFAAAIRALSDLTTCLRLYLQQSDHSLLDPLPIEILWSVPDDEVWGEAADAEWAWTAMVAQASSVTPALLAAVRERLLVDHPDEPLQRVHLGSMREGICAQIAHCGTPDDRPAVVQRLVEQARQLGYEPYGPHHEIYLADLRHVEAAPLRTIVRQPVHRLH